MNAKILCLLFGLLFSFKLLSQDQSAHINFTLFIDGKFIKGGVHDGRIIMKDSVNQQNDSIEFRYEAGDMTISITDYNKLSSLSKYSKLTVKFKYLQTCPDHMEYTYQKIWQGPLLTYRYIIFRIYNFSNKINYPNFWERKGYGVEIEIPAYSTILERKKYRKNRRPACD